MLMVVSHYFHTSNNPAHTIYPCKLSPWSGTIFCSESDTPALTTQRPATIFTAQIRRTPGTGNEPLRTDPNCVFCQIVAGKSPARVRYLDNDIIVIVNRLDWVPLMLLVMPKEHLSQIGMWDSDLLPRLGKLAVDMGAMYSPNGFRILSNFGRDGLQSQSHGHLHVVGGTFLGHYVEHDIFSSSVQSPYPTRSN